MYKKLLTITLFSLYSSISYAQIGIGTINPDQSSILDVESTTKGFLPPRVNNPNSDISNPATGLLVYSLTDECLKINKGTPSSPTWECLSGSGDGSVAPTNPVNPNLTSDCGGVFYNTSSFGIKEVYAGGLSPTYYPFLFHLNEDGTKLYNNYGHYYDTNSTIDIPYFIGSLDMTTQVNAINQIFPTKTWKDFFVVDGDANKVGSIFLLSKDGELHSTVLHESNINQEQKGYATALIDPANDNDLIKDPSSDNNDYRFTPYTHIANDNDPSIKFSSVHYSVPVRTGGDIQLSVFPYDSTNKKFYSFGAAKNSSKVTSLIGGFHLGRTTTPTTLKESLTLREADLINSIITHFGTEFLEATDRNITFHTLNIPNTIFQFITTDGYLNIIWGTNRVYRFQIPGGIHFKSILGYSAHPYLGDDGKLYELNSNINTSTDFNISNITVAGVGSVQLYEPNYTIDLAVPGVNDLNNLNIKQVYLTQVSQSVNVMDTDGKLYLVNYINGAITNNYNANYNVPIVTEILASYYDMVVKDANGVVFTVTYSTALNQDFPDLPMGNSAVGYDGIPISNLNNDRVRLLFNCFGN